MSIKIENENITGWEAAIRGARSPMNSWEKSDSKFIDDNIEGDYSYHQLQYTMGLDEDAYGYIDGGSDEAKSIKRNLIINSSDHKLLMTLANGGTEEAKWRRFIHVSMDITAPLYWWKEFETYKVGTVSNSCSTMHKIQAKEFTLNDFSHEHLISDFEYPEDDLINNYMDEYCLLEGKDVERLSCDYYPGEIAPIYILEWTVAMLNRARELFLETKDKKYWWQMIQLLPSSYNQRRTIDLNYEVLAAQYRQRKNHKLDEWRAYCDWIKSLPYSEFITLEEEDDR